MNVLIAADMEGVAGIKDYGACLPSHPSAYAEGRRLMTELALAEAEPSMSKAHGGPLDAVVFVGHHASTTNRRAFCSHTFIWEMEVLLDGESLNEVQVYAQGLAAEGIPVLAASGDRWMLEELSGGELGGAGLVPTKEGLGRARARSFDPAATHAELRAAIEAALVAPPTPPPPRAYPAELRITVEGEELVRTTVAAPGDLLATIATVFRGSQVSREYRQLAKLLPAGHGSRLRALQRRLGSLISTPVMLAKERRWLEAAP